MKHLFIARHGNYSGGWGAGYWLNDSGRQQMEMLGKDIKEILNRGSARVISSVARRVLESSEVLITQLALPEFEQVPCLGYMGPDTDELMEIVNQRKNSADGLVWWVISS